MKRGRIHFLVFFLCLYSFVIVQCAAPQQSGTDFYEGLKKRQDSADRGDDDQSDAIACFEKALNDANAVTAAAAAAELMSLHSAGAELSPATMALVRRKAAGSWALAFEAAGQGAFDREKSLALLLGGESRSLDEAAYYVLRQWRDNKGLSFTEAENAAINGRIAASRSRYNEALLFFRIALRDSPDLFFRYPDLITDLGRTFQYTASGVEGMDLFLKWEDAGEWEFIPDNGENLVRFRLLFFAARIARHRGSPGAIELFERALPFAREISPEQADACIWYILDSSLAWGSEQTLRYLETYIPQWHDDAYFSDVLDKLARDFILKKQWENVLKVFSLLKNRSGAVTAQYAWICGRAVEEGLIEEGLSSEYMDIAYNADGSWYYRSVSAAVLDRPFLALPDGEAPPSAQTTRSDTLEFLLGFFENDAAQFAPLYISAEENGLSPEELCRLAEALGAAGQYQESMRLVSLYTKQNGYQTKRQDLELLYPRPFSELVAYYAKETGIEPALLYGLIRTESAFNHTAVSRAGAIGLTQLMPATAEEAASRIRRQGGPDYTRSAAEGDDEDDIESPALDLYDPAVNIHIGASYLAYLNERMQDPLLALLAYNGGMNRIRRWYRASYVPPDLFLETVEYPETRNYGRSVIGTAAMYKELYYKTEIDETGNIH